MSKPRLFIGSSSESLPIVEILVEELKNDAEVVPWTKLKSLLQAALEGPLNELRRILADQGRNNFGIVSLGGLECF